MRETLVKTEEFKDSLLGRIPHDWEVCPLKNLTDSPDSITYGVLKPGEYISDGIPLLQIQDVIHGKIEPSKLHRISKELDAQYARTRLYGGEIVMSLVGTIGKIAQIPGSMAGANLHRNLARIPVSRGNSSRFVFHCLQSQTVQEAIAATTFGSTQSLLNLTDLRELLVAVPPPQEQQKIANIIDTIDSAIAHTTSLIAKLKQMKAGLLHDLLTRGLDENGELRDAIGHPEQFKDSPLGQIPKDWYVLEVNQVSEDITYGLTVRPQYVPQGIPLVSTKECFDGWIDYENANKISEFDYRSLRFRSIPKPGDVLFTKTGTVGRVATIKFGDPKSALSQNVALIKPNSDIIIPEFLELSLKSGSIRRQTAVGITTLSIPDLQLAVIGKFLLPIPLKPEQSEIVIRINYHNSRIRTEEAYRDKLKLQKQGLMHDLLTGKVRVKDADKFTPASDTV